MPELPEVHTTVSQLNNEVIGNTITDVWSDLHEGGTPKTGTLKDPNYYGGFVSTVIDTTIADVERRGKNILIHLDNGQTVLIHMKMTGHLLFGNYRHKGPPTSEARHPKWQDEKWVPKADEDDPLWDPFNRYIHLVFTFDDGSNLVLSDMRKFAKITLLDTEHLEESEEVAALGPNPLELSAQQFCDTVRERRSGKIKEVLMDQSVIAGVGNIYSDEALWMSKIHPTRDVHDLTDAELITLHRNIRDVVTKAIETGGDSDSDYRDLYGRKGNYQNFHQAYRQTGKPCPRPECSGTIERIKLGSRSAHYCPTCQAR